MLPETFSEQQLRLYCKLDEPRSLEMLKTAFRDWCKNRGFPPPKVRILVRLTVNQFLFTAICFRDFVFMDIFTVIYFCGLQNWNMQGQFV